MFAMRNINFKSQMWCGCVLCVQWYEAPPKIKSFKPVKEFDLEHFCNWAVHKNQLCWSQEHCHENTVCIIWLGAPLYIYRWKKSTWLITTHINSRLLWRAQGRRECRPNVRAGPPLPTWGAPPVPQAVDRLGVGDPDYPSSYHPVLILGEVSSNAWRQLSSFAFWFRLG